MKCYLQLAAEFENLIANGTLEPGVRLPSVRQASSSYRVSPSTVFQAYYTLERRGLIVARPRSGYFVASGPELTKSLAIVSKRSIDEADGDSLIIRFMKAQRRCAYPGLGSSEPSAQLFPFARISRSLTAATRRMASSRNALSAGRAEADLRRQIALRYVVTGVTVPIDEVVVTSGALDALILCLQVLTRPGDIIAIERPSFHAVQDAVQRLHLKAVEIPVDPLRGLDLAALAEALQQHPVRACWFMTTLHQPTGATLSDERKEALVRLLAKHGVPLIEDDVFRELHFDMAHDARREDRIRAQRALPHRAFNGDARQDRRKTRALHELDDRGEHIDFEARCKQDVFVLRGRIGHAAQTMARGRQHEFQFGQLRQFDRVRQIGTVRGAGHQRHFFIEERLRIEREPRAGLVDQGSVELLPGMREIVHDRQEQAVHQPPRRGWGHAVRTAFEELLVLIGLEAHRSSAF
jgi:HAMP domain-containing protein